jgi:hypothetical protein
MFIKIIIKSKNKYFSNKQQFLQYVVHTYVYTNKGAGRALASNTIHKINATRSHIAPDQAGQHTCGISNYNTRHYVLLDHEYIK